MSHNSTFYFQSNRRRGRSGEAEEFRPPRPESFSTTALMGRLAALDEQMGVLLRGEGRAPSSLVEPLAGLQSELAGLAVALKELAHLRLGQESASQESASLRKESALIREDLNRLEKGQAELQATLLRIAEQMERMGRVSSPLVLTACEATAALPAAEEEPGGITIEPVRPRLHFSEEGPVGPESVLRLDAE